MQVVQPSNEQVFLHVFRPEPSNPKHAGETTKRDTELLMVGRNRTSAISQPLLPGISMMFPG